MINNITIGDLSIDCADPTRTQDFYAALTGWEKREAYGCPAVVSDGGLLILFIGCDYEYAQFGQRNPENNRSRCTLTFRLTICCPQ